SQVSTCPPWRLCCSAPALQILHAILCCHLMQHEQAGRTTRHQPLTALYLSAAKCTLWRIPCRFSTLPKRHWRTLCGCSSGELSDHAPALTACAFCWLSNRPSGQNYGALTHFTQQL